MRLDDDAELVLLELAPHDIVLGIGGKLPDPDQVFGIVRSLDGDGAASCQHAGKAEPGTHTCAQGSLQKPPSGDFGCHGCGWAKKRAASHYISIARMVSTRWTLQFVNKSRTAGNRNS